MNCDVGLRIGVLKITIMHLSYDMTSMGETSFQNFKHLTTYS